MLHKILFSSRTVFPTQNVRYYCSNLHRSSKAFSGNGLTSHNGRGPFRLFRKQAGNQIERELAHEYVQPMRVSQLTRPFFFTVGTCTASLVGVTIWEYEYVRAQVKKMMSSTTTYYHTQKQKNISDIKGAWNRFTEGELGVAWSRLSPGDQLFIPLCGLNLLVFGLWRVPRLKSMMLRNFASNPVGEAPCRSMVLSMFSHVSFFHIFANMYVLHSFSNGICMTMGKEQSMALYLSAGCVASFASYALKVFTGISGASLGASGAILGILGYFCTRYPDSQLQIMFLPMFQFSADAALKVIMAVDLAGCIFRWKFFDHAAHLGGALFGVFWCMVGERYIWPQRKYITEKWHYLRTITCD